MESIHSPLRIGPGESARPAAASRRRSTLGLNQLNDAKVKICTGWSIRSNTAFKGDEPGAGKVASRPDVLLGLACIPAAGLDIIMVGEVRDQETAEICLRVALTGHFVLSTIHTNDALSAVTRLMDMGIEPFLLACSLRVLEAQRLVRRLCVHCKEAYEVTAEPRGSASLPHGGRDHLSPQGLPAMSAAGLPRPGRGLRGHPDHAPPHQSHPETVPARPASQGRPRRGHEDALRQRARQGPPGPHQSRGRFERHDGRGRMTSFLDPRLPPRALPPLLHRCSARVSQSRSCRTEGPSGNVHQSPSVHGR